MRAEAPPRDPLVIMAWRVRIGCLHPSEATAKASRGASSRSVVGDRARTRRVRILHLQPLRMVTAAASSRRASTTRTRATTTTRREAAGRRAQRARGVFTAPRARRVFAKTEDRPRATPPRPPGPLSPGTVPTGTASAPTPNRRPRTASAIQSQTEAGATRRGGLFTSCAIRRSPSRPRPRGVLPVLLRRPTTFVFCQAPPALHCLRQARSLAVPIGVRGGGHPRSRSSFFGITFLRKPCFTGSTREVRGSPLSSAWASRC